MRSHSVAAIVTIGDTLFPVFVPLVKVNEGLLIVVRVRHGRAGMWVRDVMATIVITTVHGVVQAPGDRISFLFILWLVDGAENVLIVIHSKLLEARKFGEDGLLCELARAIGTNTEEGLNFVADDGPLGGVHWSLPAAEVVIDEELVFVSFFALGEHRVDKEYG